MDDTDGPDGGCTTFVLTEIVRAANALGFDLIGLPRLVRLDPNVPWKTRGNGALAARFGHGAGRPAIVGRIARESLRAYPRGRGLRPAEADRLFRAARGRVERLASPAARTDPAIVAARRRPSPELYRAAVAGIVRVGAARRAVARVNGTVWTRAGSRGIVGAASAIAWPGRRRTFELIAYRRPARLGRPRRIDPASVRRAQDRYPGLFQCEDPRTRRLLVAPHTDCPVLLGLRSTDQRELPGALRLVRSEAVERWMIFASNQGTGDHLARRTARRWPAYGAGRLLGRIVALPETLRGGHVRFRVRDAEGGEIDCLAFEPTKRLPAIARRLVPGDLVEVFGGRGRSPEVRVERIRLRSLAPRPAAGRPPHCPRCRRPAGSLGRGRGFRCARCRARFPPEAARPERSVLRPRRGTYDPTPSARRHLHPVVREDAGPPVE